MLQLFGEHFVGVLGGGGDIFPSVQDLLDTLICEVESSLGAKGEIYDEPSLQEVAECIVALRNAVAPGANGIIAPLLKARLEPVAWLHKVILVVWCSGRALKAWKSALVVPLYKGKRSHQCIDNYWGISLLSIPSKVYVLLLMHHLG
jgi:hypothetical protein